MKKWQCNKCSTIFKETDNAVVTTCPNCKSNKTKKISLTPTKSYIRVFELYESVKCRECGRSLKSDKSIKRGFGPACGSYYAEKYLDLYPTEIGDRAKKRWTKDEVENLIKFAQSREMMGGTK